MTSSFSPAKQRRHISRGNSSYIAVTLSLLLVSACTETDPNVISKVSHNFNGSDELYSYRATPSDELGQAKELARKAYGTDVKSPAGMFMCTWRNSGRKELQDGRPKEIFLACGYGPKYVETPKSLVKMAELHNRLETAALRAKWEYRNGQYQLNRFEVEISNDKKSYRSQNLVVDMDQIRVVEESMVFPSSADDSFQFGLRSDLAYRRNSRNEQSDPIVTVAFSGTAEPTPRWANY